jgi:hypothetical protein
LRRGPAKTKPRSREGHHEDKGDKPVVWVARLIHPSGVYYDPQGNSRPYDFMGVPPYVCWINQRPTRNSKTKEWSKWHFHLITYFWEKMVPPALHLQAGGGPIQIEIVRVRKKG